jgi:hypothetical protein
MRRLTTCRRCCSGIGRPDRPTGIG